ncbi:hypothetical protein [Aquibium microcysteis]|uniref:hypothetical protein n=1 Tax=Aquibium microcysteis TaxID=675281 RepID=UPI00165D27FA|nr:hypothetical protein [Aquibium microcysteis]
MSQRWRFAVLSSVAPKQRFSVRRLVPLIIGLGLLCSLYGCATFSAGPARVFNNETECPALRAQFGGPDYGRYLALSPTDRRDWRNIYVLTAKNCMDRAYTSYAASLANGERAGELIAAITNIGLTQTATLISAVETKDVLTGIASGLTGAKAAYSEKALVRNSIQLVLTQMDASRALIAGQINSKLALSDAAYPLPLAESDLEEYYRAGTLAGAIIRLQSTVSANQLAAESAKQTVISYELGRGSGQAALRNAVTQGGRLNEGVKAAIVAALAGSGISFEAVLSEPAYEEKANEIARRLGYL